MNIQKVGMVGCGAMGHGMIMNLVKKGYTVYAYDVNPSALDSVKTIGAIPCQDVPTLAAEVDMLLTSLPTSEIVANTLSPTSGALSVMKEGTYIMDMSTIDVQTAERMHLLSKEYGVHFYDCPVSGGPKGAEDGSLTIMIGGDQQFLEPALPVLQALGNEIHYIGKAGSGQVVKLCNNMVVAGIVVLLSETFLTGVKAGVPVAKLAELMQLGSAQNKVLSVFGPNLIEDRHEHVIFRLDHMTKDVDLYMNLAKQGEIPALLSSIILQLYETAKWNGKGGLDTTAVSQVLEQLANHKLVQKKE